jgi:hypothetical protein
LIDDRAAEEVHRLADRLAHDIEALNVAIDFISASTITEPNHNRKRARRVLVGVWGEIAGIARALSEPPPKFHRDVGNPMPIVRRHQAAVEEVTDFRPTALPAWVEVVTRSHP